MLFQPQLRDEGGNPIGMFYHLPPEKREEGGSGRSKKLWWWNRHESLRGKDLGRGWALSTIQYSNLLVQYSPSYGICGTSILYSYEDRDSWFAFLLMAVNRKVYVKYM